MNYHITVYTNEILVEVRIARDPRPSAGYIAAQKLLYSLDEKNTPLPPATVSIYVQFDSDLSVEQVLDIKRWLSEAAKMARLLDDYVTTPADFTDAVTYEVRQVAGTLILDKIETVTKERN